MSNISRIFEKNTIMIPKTFTEYFISIDESSRKTIVAELSQMVNPSEQTEKIANKGQREIDKIYHVQNVNNTASRL